MNIHSKGLDSKMSPFALVFISYSNEINKSNVAQSLGELCAANTSLAVRKHIQRVLDPSVELYSHVVIFLLKNTERNMVRCSLSPAEGLSTQDVQEFLPQLLQCI